MKNTSSFFLLSTQSLFPLFLKYRELSILRDLNSFLQEIMCSESRWLAILSDNLSASLSFEYAVSLGNHKRFKVRISGKRNALGSIIGE